MNIHLTQSGKLLILILLVTFPTIYPDAQTKSTGISTEPFGDSMRHWYTMHDDNNIVNPVANQPKYQESDYTKIAGNILLFQRDNGGWPKNYDMKAILTPEQVDGVMRTKNILHTTFDNSTTKVITVSALTEKSQWKTTSYDRLVVVDSTAAPIWTRYYEPGTEKPLFCDRNSKYLYSMAEVSRERRSGYGCYTYAPQEVLDNYPEWQKKWAPDQDVLNLNLQR